MVGSAGQRIPLSQVGTVDVRMEDTMLRRRDRTPTITVPATSPKDCNRRTFSTAVLKQLQPVIKKLPSGYRIEQAGSIEEAAKATTAMLPLFPIMIALTLLVIILQVRSIAAWSWCLPPVRLV
ncbi:efflux RND transporter permease subunit [Xylella fastidiosa]|uniref:efflux RND transporter permease subunit n=1 Tax=Xylella fastidiosa TaxID=2371 RepID=UPI003CCF600B